MVARKTAAPRRAPTPPDTVVKAVKRDLAVIAKQDKQLAGSGLALSALALAREIDSYSNSATSKSMCAKTLLDTMDRLRELAPKEREVDGLDDLYARRAARLAGRPASSA